MEIKQAYLGMIKSFPGGWDAMAGALGMSRDGLENRIYERKGQRLHVETALQMAAFSNSTLFAQAVSQKAGGVFVSLPGHADCDREDLLVKFNELYEELGEFSAHFKHHTADNKIDLKERADLTDIGQHIHRTVQELLRLTFSIYCPHGVKKPESHD